MSNSEREQLVALRARIARLERIVSDIVRTQVVSEATKRQEPARFVEATD